MHLFTQMIWEDIWNSHWRNVVQMQLCICSGRQFEKTFDNSSGEKLFKYNQWDFASVHSDDLRKHLKTHTGEKSLKCNQCDYASVLAGNLRRHLKTHAGEKMHKCGLCDYASLNAGLLRRHMKTHNCWKVKQMQTRWLCILFHKYLTHTSRCMVI